MEGEQKKYLISHQQYSRYEYNSIKLIIERIGLQSSKSTPGKMGEKHVPTGTISKCIPFYVLSEENIRNKQFK